MSLFKRTKTAAGTKKTTKSVEPVKVAKNVQAETGDKREVDVKVIKGKTNQSYQILVKPLVTERAAEIAALGKYVFMVNRAMNKVEVKKAIRSVYNVEPIKINMINVVGKKVRYGRSLGQRKDWKKAIVTLKPGDKIEIYEGV